MSRAEKRARLETRAERAREKHSEMIFITSGARRMKQLISTLQQFSQNRKGRATTLKVPFQVS